MIATCCPAWRDASRIRWNDSACVSWVPCEKFSRKTFTPAAINASSVSGVSLDGPTVAMILVWRMI